MLSDEEKKAIERAEFLIKIDTYLEKEMLTNLLNLIEKQSKEIEELKEERKRYAEEYIHNNPWLYKQLNENYILRVESEQRERKAYIKGTNDAHELCNKKWKDKIKAKIEELQEDIKYSANPLSIDNSKFGIKVLQSLLEKE